MNDDKISLKSCTLYTTVCWIYWQRFSITNTRRLTSHYPDSCEAVAESFTLRSGCVRTLGTRGSSDVLPSLFVYGPERSFRSSREWLIWKVYVLCLLQELGPLFFICYMQCRWCHWKASKHRGCKKAISLGACMNTNQHLHLQHFGKCSLWKCNDNAVSYT